MKHDPETRQAVIAMAEDDFTVTQINDKTGVSRETIYSWLKAAGITPARDRAPARKREKAKTLGNLPLALEINRNVQRRIEEQDQEQDEEDAA